MKENKPRCSHLMKVGPSFPGRLDFSEGDERLATAQFSCVRTGTPIGPDNDLAHPEHCTRQRSCFKEI